MGLKQKNLLYQKDTLSVALVRSYNIIDNIIDNKA